MSELHGTTIATLSSSVASCFKKNFHCEPSINISPLVDTNLVPSKLARLNLWEEKIKPFYQDSLDCARGNHLIHEDVKDSQGMTICAQVGDLEDIKKEFIEEDDAPHCVLEMVPFGILTKKDPIGVFVKVVEGTAKIGTPLCIPCRGSIYIGRIFLIERYNKVIKYATSEEKSSVQIKVMCDSGEQPKLFRRNVMARELLVSCKDRA